MRPGFSVTARQPVTAGRNETGRPLGTAREIWEMVRLGMD